MTEPKTVEIFVAMDADGDFEVAPHASDAVARLEENVGSTLPIRIVCVTLTMRPLAILKVEAVVADEPDQVAEVAA